MIPAHQRCPHYAANSRDDTCALPNHIRIRTPSTTYTTTSTTTNAHDEDQMPQVRPPVGYQIQAGLRLVPLLPQKGQEFGPGGPTLRIVSRYSPRARATLCEGDCLDFLRTVPRNSATLIVTSPPYNIGKSYESRKLSIEDYVKGQSEVIEECVRILHPRGSLCWQVGNYVEDHELFPLDILLHGEFKDRGLKLRNRIAWTFNHGLHCQRRFSGRYETVLWFTKSNKYIFDLDAVRVPQKYPGKRSFRGPDKGAYSSHPLGKNPGDVWSIPNVKANHPEKTIHPCQFPIELVGRLILALTRPRSLVLDPFAGVGSAGAAAMITGRRFAGSEIVPEYCRIARERIEAAAEGRLRFRPFATPIYVPPPGSPLLRRDDLSSVTGLNPDSVVTLAE